MANARLNILENFPLLHSNSNNVVNANSLSIQGVYIPGSISFNNLAVIISGSGGVSENFSLSLGLYSLNGSTLSLANSASRATALTLNQTMFSWLTMATSATQDITPGNWWLGIVVSTSLGSSFSLIRCRGATISNAIYGGPFIRGSYSTSTNGLPISMITSDLSKEGADAGASRNRAPYILISS